MELLTRGKKMTDKNETEIDRLRAENACLRDSVRQLVTACDRLDDCRWCGNKRVLDDRSDCPHCEAAYAVVRANREGDLTGLTGLTWIDYREIVSGLLEALPKCDECKAPATWSGNTLFTSFEEESEPYWCDAHLPADREAFVPFEARDPNEDPIADMFKLYKYELKHATSIRKLIEKRGGK